MNWKRRLTRDGLFSSGQLDHVSGHDRKTEYGIPKYLTYQTTLPFFPLWLISNHSKEKVAEDLSPQERELISNLIRDGKPVPARYIPSISDKPLKTELIWPGKTDYLDTSVLPFQSIEHIDEPRKDTGMQLVFFDTRCFKAPKRWLD
jgi:hypothetical protein